MNRTTLIMAAGIAAAALAGCQRQPDDDAAVEAPATEATETASDAADAASDAAGEAAALASEQAIDAAASASEAAVDAAAAADAHGNEGSSDPDSAMRR